MILSRDVPGGNFRLISQNGNEAVIEEEQRDSKNPWFYWKFKAIFDAPGSYHFRFTNPNKVGPRGAAVSRDHGLTWNWLTDTLHESSQDFMFDCPEAGEYWFCQCIPYMQTDFQRFAEKCRDNPYFSVSEIGRTKKDRSVELVSIREGNPELAVFFTARHHAQESMASYALEGILRLAMSDTPFAKEFRKKYALYAVPFVDKDGVEDGDQGKGRIPRDHARDYDGQSLYPEITAIRAFLKKINPVFSLDMHCPWIRYASNEYSYMTEGGDPRVTIELERFAKILEQESPECAPFRAADILRWGVDWNVRANSLTGTMPGYGLKGFVSAELDPQNCYAQTVEIPFANFREKTVTPKEIRLYGESLLRTLLRYLDEVRDEKAKENAVRTAKICFTENIPPEVDEKILGKWKNAMDKADYKVGFMDSPADTRLPQVLKDTGFDFVATCGPHCLDQGYEGLYQSLYRIESAGLAHAGTARSAEEREKTRMPEINGIRVAFLAYTLPFEKQKVLTEEEAAFAVSVLTEDGTLDMLAKDMQNARKFHADFIIVLADFGNLTPERSSSIVCRIMDQGADLVVACKNSGISGKEHPVSSITLRRENGKTLLTEGGPCRY